MKIEFTKLSAKATAPTYAHPGDAGADLYCLNDETIAPGEQTTISTGIAIKLPDGHVGLTWDKSGVSAKRRLKVMGGVIDAGYRGEIFVTLANLGDTEQTFRSGEKIAQLLIQPVVRGEYQYVDELDQTARGDGAFGSTGA